MAENGGLPLHLVCNGSVVELQITPDANLADVLRHHLGLTGTKVGCGTGDCGACSVLLNDRVVCSCIVLAAQCDGATVQTIEGVSQTELGAIVVDSFATANAVQCGICSPGLVVAAVNLINENGGPLTRDEIQTGLAGNLCRCTGYLSIISAVGEAAAEWKARRGLAT